MDLICLLGWAMNLVAAFALVVLVFLIFREDLMGHLSRRMIITAIALSLTFLTTRLIRIQMTDMPRGRGLADTPLTQATGIATVFVTLAVMGPLRLIAVATAFIVMDVAWILDTSAAQAEQSF